MCLSRFHCDRACIFMACVVPCHSACAMQIVAGLTEDTMESGMEERGSNNSGTAKESTKDSDTAQGGDTEQGERPKPASGQDQFRPKQEGDFVLDVQSRQAALTEMGLAKVYAALCKQPSLFHYTLCHYCYIYKYKALLRSMLPCVSIPLSFTILCVNTYIYISIILLLLPLLRQ